MCPHDSQIRTDAAYEAAVDVMNGLLMEQHGLKQGDLSEILSRRRELNLGQIRRLSARFGIAPATVL